MHRNCGIGSCLVQNALYILGTDFSLTKKVIVDIIGDTGRAMTQVLRHNCFQQDNSGQWVYDYEAMHHELPQLLTSHVIHSSNQSNIFIE